MYINNKIAKGNNKIIFISANNQINILNRERILINKITLLIDYHPL